MIVEYGFALVAYNKLKYVHFRTNSNMGGATIGYYLEGSGNNEKFVYNFANCSKADNFSRETGRFYSYTRIQTEKHVISRQDVDACWMTSQEFENAVTEYFNIMWDAKGRIQKHS